MENIKLRLQITDSRGELLKSYEEFVNSSTLVNELKSKWSDKFCVNVQSVRFNSQTLSDDKNCNFYSIRDGDTVVIISDESKTHINLVVEVQSINPCQRSIQVKVDPNIKTEELMKVIKEKIFFNFDSAYLTHHGETLRQSVSLKNQSVKNNDIIQVLVRTKGG